MPVHASKHAYEAAKERLGWKKKTLDNMLERVFNNGIKHSDTKGQLNKYITKLWFKYETANNIRIYGQDVYFFNDMKLITLYRLPNNLIKHLGEVEKVDIIARIKDLYNKIKTTFKKKDSVYFTDIIKSKEKKDVVWTLLPLLHLSNQGQVELVQEEHFGEIEVLMKDNLPKGDKK